MSSIILRKALSPKRGARDGLLADGEGRYSQPAVLLHWAVANLVLMVSGLALFRESFAWISVWMIGVHKQLGLVILMLALIRLVWRLTHRPPPMPGHIGLRERTLAGTVHWLLYALLIFVPLAGWVFVSMASESRPLDFRGPSSIPELPLPTDDSTGFKWHEAHEIAGFGLVALFLLHLAGVFRRRWFARELVIRRMTGKGWMRLLPPFTIAMAVLWAFGLALDLFGVRLMGEPAPIATVAVGTT